MATIFQFGSTRSGGTLPPPPLATPRDWSNQELSDLYRAISSLGQSGIVVELERGLTDEGDPWLVLCRLDGEVFIHLCRLDGRYLLDSPALAGPLRGHNFAELIDLFITQAAMAAAPNVVAFRASKVLLHPAALITILVWSLYVWSSDASHAGELVAPDAELPADTIAGGHADTATAPALKTAPAVDGIPADRLVNRLQQAVDHTASLPMASNVAAMQMIAVVGTLVLSAAGVTTLIVDAEAPTAHQPQHDLTALADKPIDFVEFSDDLAQSAWAGSNSAAPLLAAAQPVVIEIAVEAVKPAPAAHSVALHTAEAVMLAEPVVLSDTHPTEPQHSILPASAPVVTPAAVPHAPPIELHASALVHDFSALFSASLAMARYDVGGVSLIASFNPSSLQALQILGETDKSGNLGLQFEAPQFSTPPEAVNDGSYNDAARAFINAFLDQSDQIQVLASANQLVLIDLTAFDESSDRAFAYTWTLDDGGTISTLGHVDIFASYHLA